MCAAALLLFAAGCETESSSMPPDGGASTTRRDGGCEPILPDNADAGGRVSPDYPTCCFRVGVPQLGAVVAIPLADAPVGRIDGGPTDDGGVAPMWMPAGEAFPTPTDALWLGSRAAGLFLDIDGQPWTVAVEYSGRIPMPPDAGIAVQVTADESSFIMTRRSDGALLLAWIRFAGTWMPLDETRSVGAIELALGAVCYGWQDSPFGPCGRGFLVYGLDATSGGASAFVPSGTTGTLEVAGVPYGITNRLVSQRGGTTEPVCGDATPPVFDADIIVESL